MGSSAYEYCKLGEGSDAFRLVDLLPGDLSDDIHVRIFSANATEYKQPDRRFPLHHIKAQLPKDWTVRESAEGDYMFKCRNGGEWQLTPPDGLFEKYQYILVGADDDGDNSPGSRPDNSARYEALSYTWGLGPDTEVAFVQDSTSTRTLKIRSNLAVALRNLRDKQRSRILWIDAMCINQQDEAEKSTQVGRMGSFYRHACRVIVFLGLASNDSRVALSTLEHLGGQVAYTPVGTRTRSIEATDGKWFSRSTDLGYDDATWSAISELLRRDWFSRLWIVQEVRLACRRSTVQCGRDSISLFLFVRAIRCLKGKTWLPSVDVRSCVANATRLFTHNKVEFLSSLLILSCEQQCSDPRDKLLGILSLLPESFASKLSTSTAYALSPAELYKDMVLTHFRYIHRLELLQFCYQAGRRLNCPSWVPDLSSRLPVTLRCRPSQFASGCSQAVVSFGPPDLLFVLSVSCDVVSQVSRPLEVNSADAIQRINTWQPDNLMTAQYPTSISLLEAHAITLRMNKFQDRQRFVKGTKPTFDSWLATNRVSGLWGKLPRSLTKKKQASLAHAIQCCEGRMYIHTREGYIGLAPSDTQVGDVIVVFLGCDSPIVLRLGKGNQFTVVGECFVHGLHDANSLLGPLPKPWRIRNKLELGEHPRRRYYFFNSDTGEDTLDDPRLGSLGPWVRKEYRDRMDEAEIGEYFENSETGELMNSDPRLVPSALTQRGVKLKLFTLQ